MDDPQPSLTADMDTDTPYPIALGSKPHELSESDLVHPGRASSRLSSPSQSDDKWEPRLPWDRPFSATGSRGGSKLSRSAQMISEGLNGPGHVWTYMKWAGRRLRSGPVPQMRPPISK